MSWLVLDASAGVEIVLHSSTGTQLLPRVTDPELAVAVPEHFHIEVAGALRRLIARADLAVDRAELAFRRLLELELHRGEVVPLLAEAWQLRHNLTVADAVYVVLARRLGAPLLTTDERLVRAPGLGISVLGVRA